LIAGRYTLEAEIGRGGMGAVWRGRDEVLGRTVALKRIGVAPGGITPDALRAEREAKLAAKLNHANVVAVFDLVEEVQDGRSAQWLVMEHVAGTDLAELVRQRGRLSPDQAAPILAQTASALAAAHAAGIVHRDVKPSNILVAPDGQVKLSDFGIARTSADPALTQTGLVTGSPAYLSPEVASGQQAAPASDVWSWGATLFHALEGHPPYQVGDNLLGALYRIVHEEPPRSPAAGWLAPVLEGTMTRDPARRWPIATAQAFLEAGPGARPAGVAAGGLTGLGLAGETPRTRSYDDAGSTQVLPLDRGAQPPPPRDPAPPREDRPGRRPWLVVAAAAAALLVAVVVAFAIGMGRGDDDGSADPGASAPSASASGSGSGEPSPSASAEPPTEEAMTSFVESYIQTAVRDPEAGFRMLTPDFQAASNGFSAYEEFWGSVSTARIESISADPDTLEVRYRYRYVRPGGPVTQAVVLRLVRAGDGFLIDGEG